METIIHYFSTIPPIHRTLILVSGLTFFWVLESIIPFFKMSYNKWSHALTNIIFTITTVIVNFSMAFILVKSSDWVTQYHFGLIYLVSLPNILSTVLGLFLMDLIGAYFIHYLEHHTKWMWRFHLVHHTDQHIDTTTANRHHPGESIFRFLFTTMAVFIIGAPMWMVFMYQTMSILLTQFNHANIQIPMWLNNILIWVICTPQMHRVHHHYRAPYTDSNFGNIFSFWDRIFKTFKVADNSKLIYGLDTHMDKPEANNLKTLFKAPFLKYRKTITYNQEERL